MTGNERLSPAGHYQVWHDHHWPESRLSQVLGGYPEPPFPESYTHVANVRAESLAQVVELTNDKGSMLDGAGNWQSWRKNPGVEVLVMAPRDTCHGDVIVDPHGRAHRVEPEGFKALTPDGKVSMNKSDDADPDWDLSKVRPVTKSLIQAIAFDVQPTPAAMTDFGITSQEHYEAIYYPARNDEISFAQLDAAYGNGPMLTELVNAAPSNPHKGIEFSTPWDAILGHERPTAPTPATYQRTEKSMDDMQRSAAEQAAGAGQSQGKGMGKR